MRCISYENGTLEVNWMWLPTFIAQNQAMMREIGAEGAKRFSGREVSDELLDQIHYWVIDWICEKFPIEGLKDYLVGIEKVPQEGNDVSVSENAV